MVIGNIVSMFNQPWAIDQNQLATMSEVIDNKLNGYSMQDILGLTENNSSAKEKSVGWDFDQTTTSNGLVSYLKFNGTLVPRTGSMKPYCGMTPTIQLASIIDSVPDGSTLVLHADSGGGSVTGISECVSAIDRAKERGVEVIGFTDTVCGSAAYWILSHADTIVASPSAIVGSIGVFLPLTKKTGNDNYKTTIIKAGDYKAYGSPNLEASEEEIAYFQASVDKLYSEFCQSVADGRNLSVEDVKGTKAGTFQAKETVGVLVDKLMTLDELTKIL